MHSEQPNNAYTPAFRKDPQSQAFGTQRKQQIRPPVAQRSLPQDGGCRDSTSPGRHVGSSELGWPAGR